MHLIVDIPQIYSSSKPVLLLKRMGWMVGITPRLGISTRVPITFVQFFFLDLVKHKNDSISALKLI